MTVHLRSLSEPNAMQGEQCNAMQCDIDMELCQEDNCHQVFLLEKYESKEVDNDVAFKTSLAWKVIHHALQ